MKGKTPEQNLAEFKHRMQVSKEFIKYLLTAFTWKDWVWLIIGLLFNLWTFLEILTW